MNGKHFLEWFEEKLITNLTTKACIVMDNAPYHNQRDPKSVAPNTSDEKDVICNWLKDKNIQYEENMKKVDLLKIVAINKPKPVYKTDQIAESKGHVVLRLPIKHCELNPIELIQAQEKQYVVQHNTTFKMADVKQLFYEAKDHISVESWQKVCNHVIEHVENKFWQLDNIQEKIVEHIIINDSDSDSVSRFCEQKKLKMDGLIMRGLYHNDMEFAILFISFRTFFDQSYGVLQFFSSNPWPTESISILSFP